MAKVNGIVVTWTAKGFGFARPANDPTADDVFVHVSAIIDPPGIDRLFVGDRIAFDTKSDAGGNDRRLRAINVEVLDDAA